MFTVMTKRHQHTYTAMAAAIMALLCLPAHLCQARRTSVLPKADSNGICLITDTIDLGGMRVYAEQGATLRFDGGFVENGTLMGTGTKVEASDNAHIFAKNLKIGGTWEVETAWPEWFGAKGDGMAYYDLPVCCYNGNAGDIAIVKAASADTVKYPNARIVFGQSWNCTPRTTTKDVLYCPTRKCFVLLKNGKYHSRWKNSNQWNDRKTGHARKDVLFSDLTTRTTYIFDGNCLTCIDSTMTNDAEAIHRAITMAKGNVKLHNKVYYLCPRLTNGPNKTPWKDLAGFDFDGGGATLFIRTSHIGDSIHHVMHEWAWMYHCSDGKIHDLKVRSVRDRDDGTPKRGVRFSSSDSRIAAFVVLGCHRLHFSNLDFRSMSHDFIIKSGFGISSDIHIDNWYSKDVSQNIMAGCNGIYVSNAHLQQTDLIGAEIHLIYGQSYLKGMFFKNCSFTTTGPNTSVMLTYHGGKVTATKNTYPDSIYYDNCIIEGARMVQGGGLQHQTFRNCTFRQKYDKFMTSKCKLEKTIYAIIGSGVNLKFVNCRFELPSLALVDTANSLKSKGRNPTFEMDRCTINSPSAPRALIRHPGKVTITNCKVNTNKPLLRFTDTDINVTSTTVNGKTYQPKKQ